MIRAGVAPVTPGAKVCLAGQEYIAVLQSPPFGDMLNCLDCSIEKNSHMCDTTPCGSVVWMTPIKLITLRITK